MQRYESIGSAAAVAHVEARPPALRDAPFDLALEVRRLMELYALRARTKGAAFHGTLALPDPCWVEGDARRIRQALHQLLGCALELMPGGAIGLRAALGATPGAFSFEVHGADELALETHPRYACQSSGRQGGVPFGGIVRGLATARELARAMRGDVTCHGTSGATAILRFEATLRPLAVAPDAMPNGQMADTASDLRVLVVEDEEVNALIADAYLRRPGLVPTRVEDGRSAVVAALSEPRPHLVLMDCALPGMDGYAATREIRRIEASDGLARVPIIAMTAIGGSGDRARCLAAGMDGVLNKPLTSAEVLRMLHAYLPGVVRRSVDGEAVSAVPGAERTMH